MGNKLSAGRKRQTTRVSPGREKRYDSKDVSLNFVDADDVLDCKYQIEFFTNFLIFFFFYIFLFGCSIARNRARPLVFLCVSRIVLCEDYESLRATMSCGHAVTPMSLTAWCRRQLDEVRASASPSSGTSERYRRCLVGRHRRKTPVQPNAFDFSIGV